MATVYKVLGQSAPAATSLSTLYSVPAATEAVVSTIAIANRAGTSGTYRIAVRPAAASIENQHYIVYGATVAASDSVLLTLGITLAATDVISVFASSADMSFSAFGSEIS
jgi:hypothetical protein